MFAFCGKEQTQLQHNEIYTTGRNTYDKIRAESRNSPYPRMAVLYWVLWLAQAGWWNDLQSLPKISRHFLCIPIGG